MLGFVRVSLITLNANKLFKLDCVQCTHPRPSAQESKVGRPVIMGVASKGEGPPTQCTEVLNRSLVITLCVVACAHILGAKVGGAKATPTAP